MTPAALLLVVFAVPVGWGFGAWLYTFRRDRRQMARAFAHGRAEGIVRLPMQPPPQVVDTGNAA